MAELPERLREAAVAHRPDRERMLARVDQAIAAASQTGPGRRGRAPDRPPAPWMRVAAVAAAVAGAVGLGGLAVGAVAGDSSPGQSVVSPGGGHGSSAPPPGSGTPGTATSRPHSPARQGTTATGRPSQGAGHASGRTPAPPASAAPGGTPTTTAPPAAPGATGGGSRTTATGPAGGGASSTGSLDPSSNDYWTQSDVRLTVGQPLTSLTVEVRIARTAGVSSTGSFDSVPGQTAASVTADGGYLVYRWQLDAGQTLAPGTYTFAGQFNHAQGSRDTGGDRYTVVGDGPGGAVSLGGGY